MDRFSEYIAAVNFSINPKTLFARRRLTSLWPNCQRTAQGWNIWSAFAVEVYSGVELMGR